MKQFKKKSLDELCVNTIRMLSIDAIQKADSGHPGLPLGAAPMAYLLWTRFLKHNPKNPKWYDRDRFVLSAGHGSMLLYSLLHLTGYAIPMAQVKQFRQWGSITPGHPESELTPGVETTTGPLGQGFANGVGMAIAEAYLAARYNHPGFNIIDHYTYGIVSDGDLMEGVASEAASLAGHLQLGKLIYFYDNNHITLSASTHLSFTEDRKKRFDAYGWHTQVVDDGNNLGAIETAIETARRVTNKPSLILVKTIIGYGSPHKQNTFEAHGSPLGEEEVKLTKQNLDWPEKPTFYIPPKVGDFFRKAITRGNQEEKKWHATVNAYAKKYPKLAKEFRQLMKGELQKDWDENIPIFSTDAKGIATRDASEKVMQAINPSLPGFIGGSADLNTSTKTALINFGNFESPKRAAGDLQGSVDGGWNYAGRNIFYGIREHAMGAISNGLATVGGIIPFAATFLVFSDYMRPPIRLAALMKLQVIYVFTHDSIALGEDGPTHQPVEQLASLRAIPNLIVIRPADANETAVAWKIAIEERHNPVALILTRQKVPTLDRNEFASAKGLSQGAYILSDAPKGKPDIILIATGSEVSLIVAAKQKLHAKKISVRIVSMPSWELFEAQSQKYRDSVLPPSVKARLSIEAGVSQGWERYVGDNGDMISVEDFGASAPGPIVMQKYGFTVENVCKRALALIKKIKK
ncbi:MAG: transketolase [Gammaproteobacteria bacterium]|nr:transketolase [Gammaproteobacteria bacterium]